ncbi:beta-aspartyl-peptidase (threonine type) [Monoraphidium neglectum]|uniref:beta-aspartyl-peptidase n=1 Tax=Monoraphidium neglectum TaxID=145388 RepID=A0A0D2KBR0_9CHLO|nr:beta-aspartyl-peptidase (threonine type) [Monoraphidium neglectum]KIZ07578.1 beta-aspartyl-peptidase (threonine type) [Monoraphidium neglectum]|eukprot:XP_013906597.1 beta-aspartyl-peptidase (threonine type) [Monoraphidium neglectum]
MEAALQIGVQILEAGGSALDAAVACVVALEENPRFNAGRGSVLTASGRHELEASVMTQDKRCGAAALLTRVRNPILLARRVMERTPHIFLAGPPAEEFAAAQGLEVVPSNEWFTTEQRRQQWEAHKASGAVAK